MYELELPAVGPVPLLGQALLLPPPSDAVGQEYAQSPPSVNICCWDVITLMPL